MKARYRVNVAKPDTPQTFDVVDTETGDVVKTYRTFDAALRAASKLNTANPRALASLATVRVSR